MWIKSICVQENLFLWVYTKVVPIQVEFTIFCLPHDTAIGQHLKTCPGHGRDLLIDGLSLWGVGPEVGQTAQLVKEMHQARPYQALLFSPTHSRIELNSINLLK